MTGTDCKLTLEELDAAIYALEYTFGGNAMGPHDIPHNTRVYALKKLEGFRASLSVTIGVGHGRVETLEGEMPAGVAPDARMLADEAQYYADRVEQAEHVRDEARLAVKFAEASRRAMEIERDDAFATLAAEEASHTLSNKEWETTVTKVIEERNELQLERNELQLQVQRLRCLSNQDTAEIEKLKAERITAKEALELRRQRDEAMSERRDALILVGNRDRLLDAAYKRVSKLEMALAACKSSYLSREGFQDDIPNIVDEALDKGEL